MIGLDNQITWVDPHGDKYGFYLFTAHDDTKHISIDVSYKDVARGEEMRKSKCSGFSFAVPYEDGIIDWHAYDFSDRQCLPIRIDCISEEAKKFADRLIKLLAFA